jgi:hypothetical protein
VMSPACAVDESYANGYGNSKWAGEVLLPEAHDCCALPVKSAPRTPLDWQRSARRMRLPPDRLAATTAHSRTAPPQQTAAAVYKWACPGNPGRRRTRHRTLLRITLILPCVCS